MLGVRAGQEFVHAGEHLLTIGGEVAAVQFGADAEQPGAGPGHNGDGTE